MLISTDVDEEDRTPTELQRHYERCTPCVGTGRITVEIVRWPAGSLTRRCTWCRGYGWVKCPSPARVRR